jgi:hypothetical protein
VPAHDDGLSEIVVTAQRMELPPAFGSHYVDQGLMGAGEVFETIGSTINDNPILKWTLVGLDVAAGPVAFAARTAIESRLLDVKRAAEERIAVFTEEKLSAAGNEQVHAEYGGGGAVGLIELALGGTTAALRKVANVWSNFAMRRAARQAARQVDVQSGPTAALVPAAVPGTRIGARRISQELYDELRELTPTRAIRRSIKRRVRRRRSSPGIYGHRKPPSGPHRVDG